MGARRGAAGKKSLARQEIVSRKRQVADEMSRLLTQHFGRPVPVEPSMTEAHYQEFVAFCKEGGFRID